MSKKNELTEKVKILAPAGNKASFLAAIAAGADAVYCGLKLFSARMESDNFTFEQLNVLTRLSHEKGIKVYVAFNSIIKPDELDKAGRLLDKLNRVVKPDGIIIQDFAILSLVKQLGFKGEVHLSTLANMSFSEGLGVAKRLGFNKVVIPRELNIDEIKEIAKKCPDDLDLEIFIHGALCYGVSGRCYWSSFLGGKSGLRGRCVQPCRRVYEHQGNKIKCFSCQDLSLDVLVKVLKTVKPIKTWKIEGRKKGPHYVFYTVKGYQILRDQGSDPQMKKNGVSYLEQSLGRIGTHYNFLSQRPQNPIRIGEQTASGRFIGKIQGSKLNSWLAPREELFIGDLLRFGYEDEKGHTIYKVNKNVPKKGKIYFKDAYKKGIYKGMPAFLIDRREKGLDEMLQKLDKEIQLIDKENIASSKFQVSLPEKNRQRKPLFYMNLSRDPMKKRTSSRKEHMALWLSKKSFSMVHDKKKSDYWWWLSPVIWPSNESAIKEMINKLVKKGADKFVLNAPWQIAFFDKLKVKQLWAGPFCNQANGLSVQILSSIGFNGVIVSPELSSSDYMKFPSQSPLPLGIVINGFWPLTIARTIAPEIKIDKVLTSPKGEQSWIKKQDDNFWIYPNWKFDISSKKQELQKAGYALFIDIDEQVPNHIKLKKRQGMWNWNLRLL